MRYLIYLRKSRADAEAEARGEEETLARHERALRELAARRGLPVEAVYREVVSGETIAARPVMQRLLCEVERGLWTGVLVMEIERLARGDTVDQGIVAQAFRFSGTLIVTPCKTYDPNDEFDEEYFEFGLFMSRREYKTINRRLQRGRLASAKEGKYAASKPPYGYRRKKLERDKGYTLEIMPREAEVVRTIFSLSAFGEAQPDGTRKRLGASLIAQKLNALSIPSQTGGKWSASTIRDLLCNPVYIGKIRWNRRKTVKKSENGQIIRERPRTGADECLLFDGLHPPLIDPETFSLARHLTVYNPPRPVNRSRVTKNPLCGLVICGNCGRRMVRRPYAPAKRQPDFLVCPTPGCGNVSAALPLVEARILQALAEWLPGYRLPQEEEPKPPAPLLSLQKAAHRVAKEKLRLLDKQMESLHSLLEQGVYDVDTFLERRRLLLEKQKQAREDVVRLERETALGQVRTVRKSRSLPADVSLSELYAALPSPQAKNDLLKELLEKAVYRKESSARRGGAPDRFSLTLYPKLPMR